MFEPKVVETHTALLFFVGDHVYKLKKTVDLGFLDHRDREVREATCHREVDLNRRLAPDVYFGVLDLVDEDGHALDHLVDMRRMDDDRRLSRVIGRGEDAEPSVRSIAHAIAALHERGGSDPVHDALASRDAVRQRWVDGFEQVRSLALGPPATDGMARMEEFALRYLAGREALFDERISDGWIRDGHGDLQAEDIFILDDGPRILDCIEFSEDYRWGDVLSDVAFLAMDLERLERRELATTFLRLHRELCADRWPTSLADHYIAYRAHVRAKVEVVRSAQQDVPIGPAALGYIDLANAHLRAAQVQMVLVGGEPGTGKSTLARLLGDRVGAVVLRTDEVRLRVDAGGGGDRYAPEAVTAIYVEMLREAQRLVALGEHVVLDATWGAHQHRELARQAATDASCDLIELRCTLPRVAADARIRRRQAEGSDPSEVTVEIAGELASRFERWPEASTVSTEAAPDAVGERAMVLLDQARDRLG